MGEAAETATKWWWSFVAGTIFAVGALIAAPLAGIELASLSAPPEGQLTWASLFLGAFLSGSLFWWLVASRPNQLSLRRGIVTGVLVGLACYPVTLTIAEILRRDPERRAETILDRVLNVLELTALTLVTTGFVATLAMAAVGGVTALVLRPLYPRRPPRERSDVVRGAAKFAIVSAGVVVALLAVAFVWLTLIPLDAAGLTARRPARAPAATHEQALAAYEAVRAEEAKRPLHPRCSSMLLTHGAKVAKVIVFFHGLTNCPAQFDELAPKLFELGYNVYVPLQPGHGEADPMTMALVGLTAEAIVANAETSIDLAHGLGDEVYVMGLSGGGTMAMWAAQHREDADHSIALAPFLGPHVVPSWANRAAANLLLILPNVMFTWNPLEPLGTPEMDYAYPRVPTHALGQFMRLGEIVADDAREAAPLAGGLGLLVNKADFAVNNALARRVAEYWEQHGRQFDLAVLPLSAAIIHDLIDPRQPLANTDFVYPLLLDMIARQPPLGTTP